MTDPRDAEKAPQAVLDAVYEMHGVVSMSKEKLAHLIASARTDGFRMGVEKAHEIAGKEASGWVEHNQRVAAMALYDLQKTLRSLTPPENPA